MPFDDPDPTDPMTLHGVELDTDSAEAARDMAACFVEEYVRLGLSASAILDIFTSGSFAGPAMSLRQLGTEAINVLIEEQFARRGPRPTRLFIEQSPGGAIHLPVLQD